MRMLFAVALVVLVGCGQDAPGEVMPVEGECASVSMIAPEVVTQCVQGYTAQGDPCGWCTLPTASAEDTALITYHGKGDCAMEPLHEVSRQTATVDAQPGDPWWEWVRACEVEP